MLVAATQATPSTSRYVARALRSSPSAAPHGMNVVPPHHHLRPCSSWAPTTPRHLQQCRPLAQSSMGLRPALAVSPGETSRARIPTHHSIPLRTVSSSQRHQAASSSAAASRYQQRDLPPLPPSKRPIILAFLAFSIISWSAFTLYAMNAERASSSAFRSALTAVKEDSRVNKVLGGDPIKADVKWWAGGKVWVNGSVNLMQGKVDISFRVKGDRGESSVKRRASMHVQRIEAQFALFFSSHILYRSFL